MRSRLFRCLLFVILMGLSFGVLTAQSPAKKRRAWEPNLDQPIGQLEEVLGHLEQQQPENYTIANISFLYDAKLFCIFHRYVEGLTPSKRKKAWRERNQWLLDRKKAIDAAAAEYEGGSMAPYAGGQASIDFTKKRIRAIEELLIKQDPKGN